VIDSLTAVFEAADTDGSGELDRDEFDEALAKKTVRQKLESIEVMPEDLKVLFELLDSDGSGQININEFRYGCMKLQGNAKSKDMIKLAVEVSAYNRNLDDMQAAMEDQNAVLQNIYNRLYDLEKQYFNPRRVKQKAGKGVKKGEAVDEEKTVQRKRRVSQVSILGAFANAGRHAARRKTIEQQEREARAQKNLPAGGPEKAHARRGSVDVLRDFMKGNLGLAAKN